MQHYMRSQDLSPRFPDREPPQAPVLDLCPLCPLIPDSGTLIPPWNAWSGSSQASASMSPGIRASQASLGKHHVNVPKVQGRDEPTIILPLSAQPMPSNVTFNLPCYPNPTLPTCQSQPQSPYPDRVCQAPRSPPLLQGHHPRPAPLASHSTP